MCHKGTVRLALLALAGVLCASAQTEWRRIGTSAVESRLAGPVSGPMTRVWYSDDGALLYARTSSGKIFQTQDFITWEAAVSPTNPPRTVTSEPVRKPDPSARYFTVSSNSQEYWGLGRQLYRSDDGKNWESLTAYRSESVVGPGLHDLAISPANTSQLVVANDNGVWRSMDGGLTWASLNQLLPNLGVKRILATPSSGRPARIQTENFGVVELLPGNLLWRGVPTPIQPDAELRRQYSSAIRGADVSSFAASADGSQVYSGTEDGSIWRSVDRGATFKLTAMPAALVAAPGQHKVERLYVDSVNPSVVLAALSGDGPHVLRTFNAGNTWEILDSASLPNVPAYAITADRTSGSLSSVYLATDKGVFWTRFDLDVSGTFGNVTWANVSGLPQAKAVDVMLDPAGVQLYVALEGYGVYGSPAPHRSFGLRLVNTADSSSRPAAPGSLVSAIGEKIRSVTGGNWRFPVWSDSQFQVPFEATGPTVSLALETANGRMMRDLQLLPVSPAIFVDEGIPVILDADSGLPLDRNVAHPGQRLHVLMTGLGRVRPDWPTGMEPPVDNPPAVVAKVQAYVDRSEVAISRATLLPHYVGYYVVEVQLPLFANYGAMELYVAADGRESNHVQIVIAQ